MGNEEIRERTPPRISPGTNHIIYGAATLSMIARGIDYTWLWLGNTLSRTSVIEDTFSPALWAALCFTCAALIVISIATGSHRLAIVGSLVGASVCAGLIFSSILDQIYGGGMGVRDTTVYLTPLAVWVAVGYTAWVDIDVDNQLDEVVRGHNK